MKLTSNYKASELAGKKTSILNVFQKTLTNLQKLDTKAEKEEVKNKKKKEKIEKELTDLKAFRKENNVVMGKFNDFLNIKDMSNDEVKQPVKDEEPTPPKEQK